MPQAKPSTNRIKRLLTFTWYISTCPGLSKSTAYHYLAGELTKAKSKAWLSPKEEEVLKEKVRRNTVTTLTKVCMIPWSEIWKMRFMTMRT